MSTPIGNEDLTETETGHLAHLAWLTGNETTDFVLDRDEDGHAYTEDRKGRTLDLTEGLFV